MTFRLTMPALGESVTEGTVTRWLKSEGDHIAVDEPLLEVLLGVDPLQELLRGVLVLRVLHQHVRLQQMKPELTRRSLGQRRMQDIGVHRRALLSLVLVGLAQRLNVDRCAIQCRGNRL